MRMLILYLGLMTSYGFGDCNLSGGKPVQFDLMSGQVVRLRGLLPDAKDSDLPFLIRIASKDLTAMSNSQVRAFIETQKIEMQTRWWADELIEAGFWGNDADAIRAKAVQQVAERGLTNSRKVQIGLSTIYEGGKDTLVAELHMYVHELLFAKYKASRPSVQEMVTNFYLVDALLESKKIHPIEHTMASGRSRSAQGLLAAYSLLKGISAEAAVEQFANSRQKIDGLRLGKLSGLERDSWFRDPIDLYSVVVVAIQSEDVGFGLSEAVDRIDQAERFLHSKNPALKTRPNYYVRVAEISARFGLPISSATAKLFHRVLVGLVYSGANLENRIGSNRSAEDAAFDVYNGRGNVGRKYNYLRGGGSNSRPKE